MNSRPLYLYRLLALLCLLPVFFSTHGSADPLLTVSAEQTSYNVRPYLLYLEDAPGILDIDTVQALNDSAFQPLEQAHFNGGYSDSVFWLRLDLRHKQSGTDAARNNGIWTIEISYAALDYVDLYHKVKGKMTLRRSGDRLPYSQRYNNEHLHTFVLTVPPEETVRYYLRVQTTSSLQLPIRILTPPAIYSERQLSQLAYGIYFGIFIIMALYNLFLYFSLQDRSYLFYVLYILSFGTLQASISGLSFRYLWPESPDWANINIPFFMAAACFFAVMFSRLFLSTKTLNLHLDRLLKLIGIICFGCALLPFFFSYGIALQINNTLTAVVTLVIIIAGILATLRGSPGARYFLMGWSAILIGATLFMLHSAGIVPANPITLHASEIGSSIEVLLLSLALGDRIKNLREDKTRAEERARNSLAEANAELSNTLMQLEKSNSLKDDFLAKVSHELRTPLNGISGSVELMQYENLSPRLREYTKSAELSSKHMLELVNTLLRFAESQADDTGLAREEILLDAVCDGVTSHVKSQLHEKALVLRCEISDTTPIALIGDKNKLNLVLKELLEHCVNNSSGGTLRLTITTRKLAIKDCRIGFRFELQKSHGKARLTSGGSNMELTICQQLVNQMRGDLEINSKQIDMTLPFDLVGSN